MSFHKLNIEPGTAIIYYMWWGMHPKDRGLWTGEIDGEIWDYGCRAYLKNHADKKKIKWVVLRYNRKLRTFSIAEQSKAA